MMRRLATTALVSMALLLAATAVSHASGSPTTTIIPAAVWERQADGTITETYR